MNLKKVGRGLAGSAGTYYSGLSALGYNTTGALAATLGSPVLTGVLAPTIGIGGSLYLGYLAGKRRGPGARNNTKRFLKEGWEIIKNSVGPRISELNNQTAQNIKNALETTTTKMKDSTRQKIAENKIRSIKQEKEKILHTIESKEAIEKDIQELREVFQTTIDKINSDIAGNLNQHLLIKRKDPLKDGEDLQIHIFEGRGTRHGEIDHNDYMVGTYDESNNKIIIKPDGYITEGYNLQGVEEAISEQYKTIENIFQQINALNIHKDSDHKDLDVHTKLFADYQKAVSLLKQKLKDLTINTRKNDIFRKVN